MTEQAKRMPEFVRIHNGNSIMIVSYAEYKARGYKDPPNGYPPDGVLMTFASFDWERPTGRFDQTWFEFHFKESC